ncbi:MAG: glycosyltransferase family 4 protein [Moorellales bacterium]
MAVRVMYLVRPCRGGMLQHLNYLLRYLDRRKFIPLVVGPAEPELVSLPEQLGADFRPLALQAGWYPWSRWRLERELEEIIRSERVELVHTHGVLAGLVGRRPAHRLGVPVVATYHNLVYSRPGSRWRKALVARWQKGLAQYTDRYLVVCRAVAEELVRVEGVPPEKIAVIPNGIDADRLQNLFEQGVNCSRHFPPGTAVVGTFSRLIPEKGVDVFLRAAEKTARQWEPARFLIVGDGPQRRRLESLCRRLGLEARVRFLGWVDEAAANLPHLAVYVQPSRQEGLSMAVLEAMAAGRAVVASATGGLAELIRPGKNGLLVAPGNPEELAGAILGLLRDPDRTVRLGQEARRTVQEKFSARRMAEKTQEVYHQLLDRS